MAFESRIDRHEPRVPFFGPVVASGLTRCWATNISSGGVGLTAFVSGESPPARGDSLEIELALGEGKSSIRVVSKVAWTSRIRPDGRLGLGVQFADLPATTRTTLAVFLAQHRPRVLVAFGSPAEQALARRALSSLHVELVDSPEQLDPDLIRSCASIIAFCNDTEHLDALTSTIRQVTGTSTLPSDVPLAPVTLCSDLDSERILGLVTDERVYQVLRPPFDEGTLGVAIQRSCERWALQLELRWASLQLEGIAATQQLLVRSGRPATGAPHVSVVRESAAMRHVYDLIATVAGHDVPVLLLGETGTGKELAAQEIHALSKRARTPFVTQDCGALTETLLESELFGHVRGAFTGAASDHPGLFQIADGGTIFLDEIQNTSPGLQAKLLRVVEQGEVRPVGSAKSRRVDVRLIAACNVDLRQAVKEQRFRADFFYRLNRFPIELPPLRAHRDDIVPLARFFLERLCDSMERPNHGLEPRVEKALVAYDWPGNIRELKNTVERALLLTPVGAAVRWEGLPPEVRGEGAIEQPTEGGLDARVADFERSLIQSALERNDGIVRRAARELAVNPVTLSRKMRRLKMV